jgi:hypothetical protein
MPSVIGQDTTASGFDPGLASPPVTFGVWGDSASGAGVVGSSSQPPSVDAPDQPGGAGVYGVNNARRGVGVRGQADDPGGTGVLGTSAQGTGVAGQSDGGGSGVTGTGTTGAGVSGTSRDGAGVTGTSHDNIGVSGHCGHSDSGGFGFGFAPNQAPGVLGTSFNGAGVSGFSLNGVGVQARGGTIGLTASGSTFAGDFAGNVRVTGMLTKGGGGFKIDHPLDQEKRYLSHSFVESPEMKNLYDGVAVLDADGQATVALPDWFEALNESIRYQLTPLGGPAPGLHISRTLADGRFSIAGGEPRQEVCWQVTGVRRDAWARAHPLVVEEAKEPEEQGYYLHPQAHGQPAERDLSSIQPGRTRLLPAE